MMKWNYRYAYSALKNIGCPVFVDPDDEQRFKISAEDNSDKEIWADFYDCMHWEHDDWYFGVNGKINRILDKYDLYAEWQNPGCLCVCEA